MSEETRPEKDVPEPEPAEASPDESPFEEREMQEFLGSEDDDPTTTRLMLDEDA